MSDCSIKAGDRVTTTYHTVDFEPDGKQFTVLSVRPYKYAASGWMIALDCSEIPELDAHWVTKV